MSGRSPVTVYLTDDERRMFEEQARSMNMSLSAFMRWRMNTNGSWSMTTSPSTGAHGSTVSFTWNAPGGTNTFEQK